MEHTDEEKKAEIREIEVAVGVRVRTSREAVNLSQQQLAEALTERGIAMHQTTVAKLERASRPIRVNEVVIIAQILGVPLTYLIGIDPVGDAERIQSINMAQTRASLIELNTIARFVQSRIHEVRDYIDSGKWEVRTSADGNREWIQKREAGDDSTS